MWLLQLYVLFWIATFNEEITDSIPMITLQHNLTILRSSTTRTKRLKFLRRTRQIRVLVIHAVNYCAWSAELSGFKSYANPLLLFLDFATNA
jgi:hypothetical protein